jgi:hypothetical protein
MMVYAIGPRVNGPQFSYAFDTGACAFVLLKTSRLNLKCGSQVNPSRRCGGLNAYVPTKTAEGNIPSTQQGCQVGRR